MVPMALILLLVLVGITTQDTEKMISIFGTPLSYTTSTTMNFEFSDCMDYCLEMPACMVVSDNGNGTCQIFDYGQISSVQEATSGAKVAMKMNLTGSGTCPEAASDNSVTTATVVGPYNTTYSNGIWKFTTLTCPTNFTLVERPLGQWCIGVVPAPNAITQIAGGEYCYAIGGGVLSGLQSLDEYNLVIEMVQPVLAGFSATIRSYAALGFWIDGTRKASCKSTVTSASCNGTNEFTFSDPTLSAYDGYVWGPRQPSGISSANSNCIQFPFLTSNGTSTGVDDYTCSATVSDTGTTAFVGSICGVRPSVQ
ncbi:unnamed protein product [Caenorhabditis nigoni]